MQLRKHLADYSVKVNDIHILKPVIIYTYLYRIIGDLL